MKLARRISVSLLPPLALTAALGACAGRAASGGDVTGTGGGGGTSCKTAVCAAPVVTPLLLAIEIDPVAGSGAGLTEKLSQDLDQSYGPVSLAADKLVAATATFNASSNTPVPSNANILLDLPSAIPGRPDLTFQASASVSSSSAATAQLTIPQGPITHMAAGTLSLIPLPPADQQSPPYSSPVTLNTIGQLVADLPSDNFSIGGGLLGSLMKAPNTFVARAYQGGIQVSNAVLTDAGGSYLLTLPSAVAEAGGQVTVQLSPQSAMDALFVWDSFTVPNPPPTKLSLGTVMLAPYQATNTFNLPVLTADAPQSPVSGVLVQMQTNLGSSTSNGQPPYKGSTQFARSGTTNAQGIASLSLLPGSQSVTIEYTAVVVPPPGSPYATSCSSIPVDKAGATSVNTPSAPAIGPATVSRRTVLSGRVEDNSGHSVASVAITATPMSGSVSGCIGTTAAAASTTTDDQGNYSLPLDPGTHDQPVTYQLDFDPPPVSSAPRFTQPAVAVDDSAHAAAWSPGS
jgi:hypothetical protein